MKNSNVTELVNFKVLESTTEEQLLLKADSLIDFLKKQDGFVDAELLTDAEGNARSIIIHYESFEKVKSIVEKMRSCFEFDDFKSVLVPGSIGVTFQQQLKKW
jgi:hypothetical protein